MAGSSPRRKGRVSLYETHRARKYLSKLDKASARFSPEIEADVRSALGYSSSFDIETGSLSPRSPVYESGILRRSPSGRRTLTHSFIRPDMLDPGEHPDIHSWSQAQMARRTDELRRARVIPKDMGFDEVLFNEGESQGGFTKRSLSRLQGRDIWVQNMRFENTFLKERMAPSEMDARFEQIGVESYVPGGGLYPTHRGIQDRVSAAKASGHLGTREDYLTKWSEVFTEGFSPALRGPRPQGVTRAFELMDLTKSVYAMAQLRGHMPMTGELFAGTNMETFSRGLFGLGETHKGLMDAALQDKVAEHLLGAGFAMERGEELPQKMKDFFAYVGATQEAQKHSGRVKNIVDTFQKQQRFLASKLEGNPDISLLDDLTYSWTVGRSERILRERLPDRTYKDSPISLPYRKAEAHTTDIETMVAAWEERDSKFHGIKVDHQRALAEARGQYITPYNAKVTELTGTGMGHAEAIREALSHPDLGEAFNRVDQAARTIPSIESTISDSAKKALKDEGFSLKNAIRDNWQAGAAALTAVWLANKISSKDDDYNYIEGMGHAGFAGSTRRYNTDFGSGWNALRGLLHGNEIFETVLKSGEFRQALHEATLVRHLGSGWNASTSLYKGTFRNQEFQFARKTGAIGRFEIAAMKSGATNTPDLYGFQRNKFGRVHSIDMEYFGDKRLFDLNSYYVDALMPQYKKALEDLHSKGFSHGDVKFDNAMFVVDQQGKAQVGLIDLGYSIPITEQAARHDFARLKLHRSIHDDWIAGKPIAVPISSPLVVPPNPVERLGNAAAGMFGVKLQQFEESVSAVRPIPGRPASNTSGNVIQGLPEQGIAAKTRHKVGDFGSGWNPLKALLRAEETMAQMFRSSEFRDAIAQSRHVEDLSEGVFGKTTVRSAQFRGHEFQFVRKISKAGMEPQNDFVKEAALTRLVSGSVAPHVYGHSASHIDMEIFAGTPFRHTPYEQLMDVGSQRLQSAVDAMHSQGVYHSDLNPGNLMYIPGENGEVHVGIIDYGHKYSNVETPGGKYGVYDVVKTASQNNLVKKLRASDWAGAVASDKETASRALKFSIRHSQPNALSAKRQILKKIEPVIDSSEDVMIGNGRGIEVADAWLMGRKPATQGIPGRIQANVEGGKISGLTEVGLVKKNRLVNTGGNFSSPWQGLRVALEHIGEEASGIFIRSRARSANQSQQDDQEQPIEGLNPYFAGGSLEEQGWITGYQVEDADTVSISTLGGQAFNLRLAGIDAPEIEHEDNKFRVWGDQPYGQEAKSKLEDILAHQEHLRIITDPKIGRAHV